MEIPSIGVSSPLVRLGLETDGALEVPRGDQVDLAGWFEGGPSPGETGPAVIAGHVDSSTGPSVFFRLRELRPGDRIDVTRADGSVARFSVGRVEQHPKDRFPTAAVYGPTTSAELRLITCGGTFDRYSGHYEDNVVVYATAL